MKNTIQFAGFFLLILFSACNEQEEELFSPKLVGIWEIANLDSSLVLESVKTLIFRLDGSYSNELTYRRPGEVYKGYLLITNGNFISSGDQISLMPREIFFAPPTNTGPPYGPKEELVKSDFSGTQVDKIQFSISEDSQKLLLPYGSDMLYTKVD